MNLDFISSYDFRVYFAIFKTALIMFDALLILGIIYVLRKSWPFRHYLSIEKRAEKITAGTAKNPIFARHWLEIEKKAALGLPEATKIAIIEADKLVDDALKLIGAEGEDMAERLGSLPENEMRSLEDVWRAHRLRNNIVHTPGFEISQEEAKHALENYEAFLKEIEIL